MENNTQSSPKITAPQAIIIAGVLIMVAILLNLSNGNTTQVGKIAEITVESKTQTLTEIYKGTDELSEPSDHILGNENAKVTVIEYSDFECPYCKKFQPIMEKIVAESQGNVKWGYRNYP